MLCGWINVFGGVLGIADNETPDRPSSFAPPAFLLLGEGKLAPFCFPRDLVG